MKNILLALTAIAFTLGRSDAATSLWFIESDGSASQVAPFSDIYRNDANGLYWRLSSDGLSIDGPAFSRTITGVSPTVTLTGISSVFGDSMYLKGDDDSLWFIGSDGSASQVAPFSDIYRNDDNGLYWRLSSDGLSIDGPAFTRTITGVPPTVTLTGISSVFGDSMYAVGSSIPEPSSFALVTVAAGALLFRRRWNQSSSRTRRRS